MRVLACFTEFHPKAEPSIRAYAPTAEFVDVNGDDYGYWREIRARWQGKEDLMLIEQDIEILPECVAELEACEHDWCCYAYTIFRNRQRLRYGLGCTKFSARAQRLVPPRRIAEGFALCKLCKGMGCWFHLDGRITELLRMDAGLRPHVHGDVTHWHDYSGDLPLPEGREARDLLGELVEVRGKPIEHYQEDYDDTPAIVIGDFWPRREMYAMTPRQACEVAEDLHRLAGSTGNEPGGFVMPEAGFKTDKVMHGYLPTYSRIAKHLGPAARVCEIGVESGGSLDMWRVLFPQGTVAGVDINPASRWPEGSVRIVAGQNDPNLPRLLDAEEEAWDLIVDDASHDGPTTIATLDLLWKLVSPGGFYCIEDWYIGFDAYRDYDESMLVMAQALLNRLDPHYAPEGQYSDVESIEYRHGMAILRKVV